MQRLLLGTFTWLRANGYTRADQPARAKDELVAALRSGALDGAPSVIARAFIVAHDTWLHVATPALRVRNASKPHVVEVLDEYAAEQDLRTKATALLKAVPIEKLTKLVGQIADLETARAAKRGTSSAKQEEIRSDLNEQTALLGTILEELEIRLRAPLGVAQPHTRGEWKVFERNLNEELRSLGFSYRQIAKLLEPESATADVRQAPSTARERVRSTARRIRSRKTRS